MHLTLKLALRNLFRNTRRTVLTCLLIGCSLAALMLTDGIIGGMLELLVDATTRTFTGEAQVHHAQFRESQDTDYFMDNVEGLESIIAADPTVDAYTIRTIGGGMISSSSNVTGGVIYGVDHTMERRVSKLADGIVEGGFLRGGANDIVVGKEMADLLELELGDRIVITVAAVKGGDLSQALFRLTGICEFGIRQLDSGAVFIDLDKSREILGLGRGAHEIAILFKDPNDALRADLPLYAKLAGEDIEVVDWLTLLPDIQAMIGMIDYTTAIVGLLLFLLASFGIVNSLFMSIYERIYEFGVVRAIGTQPYQIAMLVVTEALLMALMSVVFGLALGGWLNYHFSTEGIPFGEMEFSGIMMANNVKTAISWDQFVSFPAFVVLLTVLTSLYPARFAARIIPSIALQRTL